MKRRYVALAATGAVLAVVSGLAAIGSPPTHHAEVAARLGVARSDSALEVVIDQPGPVTVETVVGADWVVPRSGVINLKNPRASSLEDGDEPIVIQFHALRHRRGASFSSTRGWSARCATIHPTRSCTVSWRRS
ncbi:MAG TPA: hypothetical protein VHU80_20265 [Polyangiaceae bacterium]|nr:hypothetical protein [Polyangiaceae bacterium]